MKTIFPHTIVFLFISLSLLCSIVAHSQSSNGFDINGGLSTTDAINAGIRYHFKQNAIGLNVGTTVPANGSGEITASLSGYRHLWGTSKYTEQRPWFIKGAVHFDYSNSELTPGNVSTARQAGARLYLGRDFNFSKRIGASISLGPILYFYDEFYDGTLSDPYFEVGLDAMVFYRFGKS